MVSGNSWSSRRSQARSRWIQEGGDVDDITAVLGHRICAPWVVGWEFLISTPSLEPFTGHTWRYPNGGLKIAAVFDFSRHNFSSEMTRATSREIGRSKRKIEYKFRSKGIFRFYQIFNLGFSSFWDLVHGRSNFGPRASFSKRPSLWRFLS